VVILQQAVTTRVEPPSPVTGTGSSFL
jgi:hypothetical protein